jgi:hypothetical protein
MYIICAILPFYILNALNTFIFIGPYALLFISNRRFEAFFFRISNFLRATHITSPSTLHLHISTLHFYIMAHHLYPPVQWSEEELTRVVTPSPEDHTLVMVIIIFFILCYSRLYLCLPNLVPVSL